MRHLGFYHIGGSVPDAAVYVIAGFTTTQYTYRAFGSVVLQVVSATAVIACQKDS